MHSHHHLYSLSLVWSSIFTPSPASHRKFILYLFFEIRRLIVRSPPSVSRTPRERFVGGNQETTRGEPTQANEGE